MRDALSTQRPADGSQRSPVRVGTVLLLAIFALAAALRITALTRVPPGLNQDEAVNAWNAWCLLKTGRDQTGTPWPVFYTRALGENRTTLYIYATLPFEALGGLNVWTNRLPSAVGGVLTVLLMYWIAARLFDRTTGLVAAALLALSPWHIQLSRLGHEAAFGPLLVAASLAAWLWAGLPLCNNLAQPRAGRALLAGLVAGIACYGYPAVRLFLPLFLAGCVALTWPAWWRMLRSRRGVGVVLLLLAGVAVTFGPLAYYHVAHATEIAKRAAHGWLWSESDPLAARIAQVAGRYVAHFGPDFLFMAGDRAEMQSAAGFGMFSWYVLPLILLGLLRTLRSVAVSSAARVVLFWMLLYPAGDCLHRHLSFEAADGTLSMSLHALRSAPGLGGLTLLAALGAAWVGRALWRRRRTATVLLTVFILGALALDARFLWYYFGEHNRRPAVYYSFHEDLVQACEWLRPHLADVDAVFVTTQDMNMPYVTMLVVLGYDPQQWFRDEREVHTRGDWDYYYGFGKFHFLYPDANPQAVLTRLRQDGRPHRLIFVVRPGETNFQNPVYTVRGPRHEPVLLIFSSEL